MATEDARKLFVAGLPDSITEDVLRQIFEATGGKVVDLSLPRDRATGKPRGFGFVTFASADEATSARGKLDGSLQAGRSISVRPFSSEPPRRSDSRSDPPQGQPAEDRTLYVGNLPYDTNQQELSQLFSEAGAGQIARIHLPAGPDGRLRGFGFVTMASADAANGALAALRNFEVRGRRVTVNIAHPRGSGGPPGGDRPRGPRPHGDGPGHGPDSRGHGFASAGPPPDFDFGGRPVEGRRARGVQAPPSGGGGDWSEGGGGGGGGAGEARKRKKGARRRSDRGTEEKKSGRSGTWQDWDDEDWKDDED